MHRDIKSKNIFKTKTGILKLGDFGITKVLANTTSEARTKLGTPCYLSPEMVNDKPYKYSSDIWSLGVLLYEMCSLQSPFWGSTVNELFEKISNGEYHPIPIIYSDDLRTFIDSMLNTDPLLRPNINEVICHPLLKSFVMDFVNSKEFKKEYLHRAKSMKKPSSETRKRKKIVQNLKLHCLLYKLFIRNMSTL